MDLHAEDIALALRCHVRTARRWCGAWAAAQSRPHVPRVRLGHNGRRGRPRYLVDASSFAAWRGIAVNTNAVAND